jgi:hypothetical protein
MEFPALGRAWLRRKRVERPPVLERGDGAAMTIPFAQVGNNTEKRVISIYRHGVPPHGYRPLTIIARSLFSSGFFPVDGIPGNTGDPLKGAVFRENG